MVSKLVSIFVIMDCFQLDLLILQIYKNIDIPSDIVQI